MYMENPQHAARFDHACHISAGGTDGELEIEAARYPV
jgi:hypothetical protein